MAHGGMGETRCVQEDEEDKKVRLGPKKKRKKST
jgi:hypothetical protein